MTAEITEMMPADYDEVLALWQGAEGVCTGDSDSRENIARYLDRNPGTCLVARDGEKLVAAVLCGNDGRRGYLNHLVVADHCRRRGIATALVVRCTAALKERGIPRCNLFVLADNPSAMAFWRALGWRCWDEFGVKSMSFDMDPQLKDGLCPAEADQPPQVLPTLRTERLVLRPFDPQDAATVQRLAGAREIAATLNIPHPYEDGVAEEWIAGHRGRFAQGRGLTLAITLAGDGQLIGAVSLMSLSKEHRHGEMGYWIGVAWWGRGYCTEATRAIAGFGFERMDMDRIHAHHFASNPASGRVMQKLGMTHEGTLRRHVHRWDKIEDMECYGILKSEWPTE